MYSNMRRDSPDRPSRLPATLKDWQGLPPTMRSTSPYFSSTSFQSISVMSPRLGTFGNRSASTAQGNGSISLNATGSHPRGSQAQLAASMPLNRLMYLITGHHPAHAGPGDVAEMRLAVDADEVDAHPRRRDERAAAPAEGVEDDPPPRGDEAY